MWLASYSFVCLLADNKKFTSGPNSFYCICDRHKEKPVPVDTPLEEKTDESDKNKKSFACVIV